MKPEKLKEIKNKFLKKKFSNFKDSEQFKFDGNAMSFDDVILLLDVLIKEWPDGEKKK